LWLKIGITLGGTGLVGLELWWFLLSRTKAQQAQITQGVQEIEIIVDGGYNPNQIVVRSGQPVRLKFQRKDPSSCLEQVLIPDFRRSAMLDLNQTTTIEFTPQKPGQYPFHCGMNMFRGVIFVKQA
jgi:plastocyanin domain-containing protein